MLGSLLGYVKYNGILVLPIQEEATVIGFADDLAVVVTAKYLENVEVYVTKTLRVVKLWLEKAGLT